MASAVSINLAAGQDHVRQSASSQKSQVASWGGLTKVPICSVSLSHVECFLEESDKVTGVDDPKDRLEQRALSVTQLGVPFNHILPPVKLLSAAARCGQVLSIQTYHSFDGMQ